MTKIHKIKTKKYYKCHMASLSNIKFGKLSILLRCNGHNSP